jgi:polysaccharide export outer membrane protein
VINRVSFLLAVSILGTTGAATLAKNRNADANPPSDPVMQSLTQGVDHLDGGTSGQPLQHRDGRYRLESGDVMDLQFQFTPEYNQTAVTVQPDGFITLKEVGDLHVEGLSLPELRDKIKAKYATILANPVVSVDLKDFDKPYFLAIGQVTKPGKYDLRGNMTVASAIAIAGGFTPQAKHSTVLLFRRVNDAWSSVTKINTKQMLNSRNLAEDMSLRPGDMVYVPQNKISKIKSYVPTPTMGTYQAIP